MVTYTTKGGLHRWLNIVVAWQEVRLGEDRMLDWTGLG
jgi:hypothetical protein